MSCVSPLFPWGNCWGLLWAAVGGRVGGQIFEHLQVIPFSEHVLSTDMSRVNGVYNYPVSQR